MLSLLFPILGLCASLISAEDSIPYKFKADDSSFLYATKIDDCTYKISSTGYSGVAGNSFHITDVQNINNATIVASEIGPTALLDVYKVREGGSPTAQVFVRTNMTQEEIRGTQQISVADAHLSYYSWPYQYVFYCEYCWVTEVGCRCRECY